jgi:hydrogenase 3 maturation protease
MAERVNDWRKRLRWELRAAKRLFVLGVGNPDRADDGAGSRCVRLLLQRPAVRRFADGAGQGRRAIPEKIQAFDGGEVPESATGIIRKFGPSHVLIIDTASAGSEPGTVFFINKKKIREDDITTHRIPLSHLVRYLEETVGCRVILLGIEPRGLEPGKKMSRPVSQAVKAVADTLAGLWRR